MLCLLKKEFSKIRNEEINQLFSELTYANKKIRITLDSDVDYIETNPLSPKKRVTTLQTLTKRHLQNPTTHVPYATSKNAKVS